MAPAQRILYRQAGITLGAAVLIPCVVLVFSEVFGEATTLSAAVTSSNWLSQWAQRFASMLIGGLSVVLPSWAYLAATRDEHRGERLLLFAWLKIVGTIGLMAIGMMMVPKPLWLLGGLAIAYLGHALAAIRER